METACTYFTRRARQERAKAADANSAEARKAHLELALRLVRAATERPLWSEWPPKVQEGPAAPHKTPVASELGNALANAFSLPKSSAFEYLLGAVDKRTSSADFIRRQRRCSRDSTQRDR